jgi:hypothetical protein
MPDNEPQLFLVPANKSRDDVDSSDDSYDVRDANGKFVGRIFYAPQSPPARPWFWTIVQRLQQPTERGYAATRGDAKRAFKLAWERQNRDRSRR